MTALSGGRLWEPCSPYPSGPPISNPPVMEAVTAVFPAHLQERLTVNVVIYSDGLTPALPSPGGA